MGVVVDASVALKLVLPEPGAAQAETTFASETVHAPDFVRCEIANGLIKDRRLRPRSRADVTAELGFIVASYSMLHPTPSLMGRAVEIGLDLDHQVYDCLYLALSERLGLPLLTANAKFLKKATAQGWTDIRALVP